VHISEEHHNRALFELSSLLTMIYAGTSSSSRLVDSEKYSENRSSGQQHLTLSRVYRSDSAAGGNQLAIEQELT
jgi:hypothetical protein